MTFVAECLPDAVDEAFGPLIVIEEGILFCPFPFFVTVCAICSSWVLGIIFYFFTFL